MVGKPFLMDSCELHVYAVLFGVHMSQGDEREVVPSQFILSFIVIIRNDYSKYDASMNKYYKLYPWSYKKVLLSWIL